MNTPNGSKTLLFIQLITSVNGNALDDGRRAPHDLYPNLISVQNFFTRVKRRPERFIGKYVTFSNYISLWRVYSIT